jgi:hypothetical protein
MRELTDKKLDAVAGGLVLFPGNFLNPNANPDRLQITAGNSDNIKGWAKP